MTQRNTKDTIAWYRTHETAAQIGFDPGGMCQKVCRTARNIGALYPSALTSQNATPAEHRVRAVANIRRGMVMYFDDPRDSNPYGHIVTAVGRIKGKDPATLGSILVRTNSVVSGRVVVVPADYFPTHWGDAFQFGATILNGVVLDLPEKKVTPPPPVLPDRGADRLRRAIDIIDDLLDNNSDKPRLVRALKRDRAVLRDTIDRFNKQRR